MDVSGLITCTFCILKCFTCEKKLFEYKETFRGLIKIYILHSNGKKVFSI